MLKMRTLCLLILFLLLAACGHAPARRDSASGETGQSTIATSDPCAPTRTHNESDYTPGGLYAPGVADGGPSAPIDISGLAEPVPHAEPHSRYGNRSPYTVLGKSYHVLENAKGYHERGVASWYGSKFNGRKTSSGEIYSICSFSAAHKTLPLPSFARVTNLDNGRSVIVRINDRGPFHSDRILDLSYAAAVRLGVDRTGTANVEVRAVASADEANDLSSALMLSPASVTPSASHQKNIVQVGSFSKKDNAKRVARQLKKAGIADVDLDHAKVNGQDVWRVKVGPVKANLLSMLIDNIRGLGFSDTRVFSE